MLDILIGRNGVYPLIVNLARSTVEVAVLAGLGFLADYATSFDWGTQSWIGLGVLYGIAQVKGLADQYIDPDQNRNDDQGGSTPF